MRLAETALAAGTLLLAAATTAHAGMTTPKVVSPAGLSVQGSSVGAGGGRTAVLMSGELRGHGAVFVRLGRMTTLGRSLRVGKHRGSTPTVAVGADGTVVAAWTEVKNGARAVIARPGESFGAVQTLRPDPASGTPDQPFSIGGIVVAPSGRAIIAWRTGGSVHASIAPPLGRFGPSVKLGVARRQDPSISLGIAGTVVIAWLDTPRDPLPNEPSPGPARVVATTLAEGTTTFSAPTELGTVGYWPVGASTGGGPGGALVGWWADGAYRLSRLGLPIEFSAPAKAPTGTQDGKSQFATDASGSAISVWRNVTYVGGDDLETVTSGTTYASAAPLGGVFGPAQRLSTTGWIPEPPQVAAMPDRTLAAWTETKGAKARVMVAFRRPGVSWSRLNPLTLSGPKHQVGNGVGVAADAHHAPVTWSTDRSTDPERSDSVLTLSTYLP